MNHDDAAVVRMEACEKQATHSEYDWMNVYLADLLIGKLRCRIDRNILTVYSVQIFPEYQGCGYGLQVVDRLKKDYERIVADRVRHSAKGFWGKMGFTEQDDGSYLYEA